MLTTVPLPQVSAAINQEYAPEPMVPAVREPLADIQLPSIMGHPRCSGQTGLGATLSCGWYRK